MAERMTSALETYYIKQRVNDLVRELRIQGFDSGQIGAVMGGIGLGLCCAHSGKAQTEKMIEGVRLAMDQSETAQH